jgi:hypothetical protein
VKTYPVDPELSCSAAHRRLLVCRFGFAHQDIVKAVVSYRGSYASAADGEKKVEWFFVHGTRTTPAVAADGRQPKKRGYQTTIKILEDYGHTGIRDGRTILKRSSSTRCATSGRWLNGFPRKVEKGCDPAAAARDSVQSLPAIARHAEAAAGAAPAARREADADQRVAGTSTEARIAVRRVG